jgi:hypothetical protein
MRRELMMAAIAGTLLTQVAPAQEVSLRYRPARVGVQYRVITWSEATTIIDETETPTSGAITLELSAIAGTTQRLAATQGGRYLIQVTRDSVRGRMRPAGGVWRDLADTARRSRVARVTVDERLAIRGVAAAADEMVEPRALRWARGLVGGYELVLPEAPVAVGATWNADVTFPLDPAVVPAAEIDVDPALAAEAYLTAHATFTADSIVPRGADTLVYATLSGQLAPLTLASPAEVSRGSLTVTGALGGTLIWSTGWRAFVAGALRTITTTRLVAPGIETQPTLFIRADVSQRFQLRP